MEKLVPVTFLGTESIVDKDIGPYAKVTLAEVDGPRVVEFAAEESMGTLMKAAMEGWRAKKPYVHQLMISSLKVLGSSVLNVVLRTPSEGDNTFNATITISDDNSGFYTFVAKSSDAVILAMLTPGSEILVDEELLGEPSNDDVDEEVMDDD